MANEKKYFSSRSWFAVILIAMILISTIVVISLLRERLVSNIQNQVNIVGIGEVTYVPDVAKVTIGVQVDRAVTAVDALTQLNKQMNDIVGAIKKMEIPEANIKTQNYYLAPQYDYIEERNVVAGYLANQQLVVTINDVDQSTKKISDLISAVSLAGANQIQGINFESSNIENLKQQARVLAIADAREKALVLAEAADVELDKIIGWWENYISGPESPNYYYGKGGADELQSASITTAEHEIQLEYNLSYRIK